MAGRIARLLKRQTLEPPAVTEAVAQLVRLAEAHPDLHQAAALQSALIRALYETPMPVSSVPLTAEDATTRLAAGVPLLRNTALPCTAHHLRDIFLRLCNAAITVNTATGSEATTTQLYHMLGEAVRKGRLDLGTLGNTLLTGNTPTFPEQLETQGYAADLVMTLLRLACLPYLEQVAAQLVPLRAAQSWECGYCPTCGAWPVLAEQRGLEQFRYLRCGLCASAWTVDRVFCPFCTTRDFHALGYLQVEGEEDKQRIATCEACQGYLKLRSTLTPLTTPQLLVEEIALVHLDLLAMSRGYSLPL